LSGGYSGALRAFIAQSRFLALPGTHSALVLPAAGWYLRAAMRTQPKIGRGVLYIVWGSNPKHDLRRATEAVGRIHPELPIEVVRLDENTDGFHAKARMFSLSPFRETVFHDADTLILSRLDFAFEKAAQFGIACCIDPSPWARKYSICEGEMIEYNTGVIFFTETARATFEAWERLTEQHRSDTKLNDQATFAAAVAHSNINPFVLPPNWNFYASVMPSLLAPLKIWHCQNDPPDWLPISRARFIFPRVTAPIVTAPIYIPAP
jgi:hypothetical protein